MQSIPRSDMSCMENIPDIILECGVFLFLLFFLLPKPHVKEPLVNGGLYHKKGK